MCDISVGCAISVSVVGMGKVCSKCTCLHADPEERAEQASVRKSLRDHEPCVTQPSDGLASSNVTHGSEKVSCPVPYCL